MAKREKWNKARYRDALKGDAPGIPGLRRIGIGFDAASGYNLHQFDQWTPAQKRRVRETFRNVKALEAQNFAVTRGAPEKVRALQKAFHGDIPSRNLKVAFVPHHENVITTGGIKRYRPEITITKTRGIVIKTPLYEKQYIEFDPEELARDPKAELHRALSLMPDADLFYGAVGGYDGSVLQTVTGRSERGFIQTVLNWMGKYDGKKPLTGKHANDDPAAHHWGRWLRGVYGYKLAGQHNARELGQVIKRGRDQNKERKRELKNYLKRKRVKK